MLVRLNIIILLDQEDNCILLLSSSAERVRKKNYCMKIFIKLFLIKFNDFNQGVSRAQSQETVIYDLAANE